MRGKISIPRLTDDTLVSAFEKIIAFKKPSEVSISFFGIPEGKSLADAQTLISQGSIGIRNGFVRYEDFHINFSRPGFDAGAAAPFVDLIEITTDNDVNAQNRSRTTSDKERVEIIRLCTSGFYAIGSVRPQLGPSDQQNAEIESLHLTILERLENAATRQLEANQHHAAEIDNLLGTRSKEIEEQAKKERQVFESEFAKKIEAFSEREKTLDEKQKLLDDRDNTHVRREIRRDLNTRINETLARLRNRGPSFQNELFVHGAFLLLIAVLLSTVYAATGMLADVLQSKGMDWPNPRLISAIIKQGLPSITLVATIVYYIRWLIRQHGRRSIFEDEIRKYQIDFERASWVVETALEWRRDQASQIPEALLKAISKQLFVFERVDQESDLSPADMLASALIGTASKVNLNTGLAQIEIDGRKLRKAEMPGAAGSKA